MGRLVVVVLLLCVGCGRSVSSGTVTGWGYEPPQDWFYMSSTYCGEGCTMMLPVYMHDPELWLVQVRESPPCVDECLEQWLPVSSQAVQAAHPVGSRWP